MLVGKKWQTEESFCYSVTPGVPGNVTSSVNAGASGEEIAQEVMARKHGFF